MPRIPYPDRRNFPDDLNGWLSSMPPQSRVIRMLSHAPGTVRPYFDVLRSFVTSLELPARIRELVILAVGASTGSKYILVQHQPLAEDAGVDSRTQGILRRKDFSSGELSERDRAVTEFAAAVVTSPNVPDKEFEAIRAVFSDRQIVEILQVIGLYWTTGRLMAVLDVEVGVPDGVVALQQFAAAGSLGREGPYFR